MNNKITALIALLLALSLTGCTKIDLEKKGVVDNKPTDSTVQFSTVSKEVFEKLGTKGDRAILGAIGKDGKLHFFGQDGNKFRFPDDKKMSQHKGNGKLKKTITINVYQNSPECFEIRPGDGTKFWYPWDCPK